MNALYSKYYKLGFTILGVPCNQFAFQEPGNNGTEIMNSLKYVRPGNGFEPLFTLSEKVDVNGENENPLYTYLKSQCASPVKEFSPKDKLMYDGLSSSDIRWNFEKFLINKNGQPVFRYGAGFQPEDMDSDIEQLLKLPSDSM